MAKIMRTQQSIYGLTDDLSTLTTDIAAEASRATGAESTLQSNIDAEATRATGAESTLTTNLASEVTRATGAEGVLTADLASEVSRATGAETTLQQNIDSVTSMVNSLGHAFNYVGMIDAGADEASAYDMAGLPAGQKDTGDYFKVGTAGFVKVGEDAPFYVNVGDGIVWNLGGTVDKIDNTNSQVFGTSSEIAVTGSADTGFHVAIDGVFSGRVSTLESGLSTEISRATGAESTLTTNLASEVTRATGAESALDSAKMAKAANGSDIANIATFRSNIDVYSTGEVDSAIAAQSNVTKNLSGVVANDKVTFAQAPIGGINGIAFGICRVFGVIVSAPNVADEVEITLDASDASGKTFIINGDVSGEYNGKTAKVFALVSATI